MTNKYTRFKKKKKKYIYLHWGISIKGYRISQKASVLGLFIFDRQSRQWNSSVNLVLSVLSATVLDPEQSQDQQQRTFYPSAYQPVQLQLCALFSFSYHSVKSQHFYHFSFFENTALKSAVHV